MLEKSAIASTNGVLAFGLTTVLVNLPNLGAREVLNKANKKTVLAIFRVEKIRF